MLTHPRTAPGRREATRPDTEHVNLEALYLEAAITYLQFVEPCTARRCATHEADKS